MGAKLDPRVDAYFEDAAEFARPVLWHLRGLIHKACPEVEETIKWRMPCFMYRGRIVCMLAAFKAHCSFGLWGAEMKEILVAAGYDGDSAAGSIGRIRSLKDLPEDKVLRGLLQQAFQIAGEGRLAGVGKAAPGGVKRASAKRKEMPVPEDLAGELAKRTGATEVFAGFSPSCRKEYVEWIEGAKRAETRARRVVQAVGWIAAGKRRNWKYEAC